MSELIIVSSKFLVLRFLAGQIAGISLKATSSSQAWKVVKLPGPPFAAASQN